MLMSLFALPVTVADLTTLQLGVEFFSNTAEATAEAAAINAPGATETVFTYAARLIQNNISLAQVAMADSALMEGTVAAGTPPGATNTLTLFSTVFLPPQVANAIAHGFNPTVYAAEALGLALAGQAAFNTNFVTGVSVSAFSLLVANATGVSSAAIVQFVNNWVAFYTANPAATFGLTITQASYGAAFGDAVGVALLNPTSANLQTVVSTNPLFPFTPNTIQGLVANALIDNAEGKYVTGVSLGALPLHTPLQGEAPNVASNTVFLTPNIDSPTSGFSLSPSGLPVLGGFTATVAGAVFNALPIVTSFGIAVNTLSVGDNLQDTVGDGTFNLTTALLTIGANPPFATGVTMNGIATANITGQSGAVTGFQGNITGLKTINMLNSLDAVQVGGAGLGLKTLPTNINVTNPGALLSIDDSLSVIVAAAAADLTKTIAISLTGANLGTTAAGGAFEIAISNDSTAGGTAATPNNSFGTWSITANNNTNLTLAQDLHDVNAGEFEGVGGATGLVLAGAGNIAAGSDGAGDWQFLKTIDASKTTGSVFLTGATSFAGSQARASATNPGWAFGVEGGGAGLLDDTGATFALTSVLLGSGLTFLDVSSATAAQVAALTTGPGTGVTVNAGNEIIVKDSVATVTALSGPTTFANIKGFSLLGIGGPTAADGAGGTINMALLPATITGIDYVTAASAAVFINNQVNPLTVNTFDNGGGFALTVGAVGPAAGFADSLHLIVGDTFHSTAGSVGAVTLFGDEVVTISSVGANTNTLGVVKLTPTPGGDEKVTIDGNKNITIGVSGTGAIFDVDAAGAFIANNMAITITDTGVVRLHSSSGVGLPFDLAIPGDPADGSGSLGGFPLTISTNARLIDASTSGGLIMEGGDGNYVTALTVAGSLGSVIKGSGTAGNVLGGVIGNDTFTSNNIGVADTIFTGGGADSISLVLGHTASNSLDMYSGFSTFGVTPGNAEIVRFASITDFHDVAELGWWGQATGVVATGYDATGFVYAGLAANTGTSLDATKIVNFNTASDILQLSDGFSGYGIGVHGTNGVAAGVTEQLTNGDLATNPLSVGLNGIPVTVQLVNPLDTVLVASNFLELTTGSFATATAVAAALHNPFVYGLTFAGAGLGANNSAHMYIAYNNSTDGMTHVADLALIANTGATAFSFGMTEHVSDIAILAVPLISLTGANVHLMHG
jgi:hypothetical protein